MGANCASRYASIFLLVTFTPALSGEDGMQSNTTEPYPWMDYLFYAAKQLDYQFTIEILQASDEDLFYTKDVPTNRDYGREFVTMEQTLEKLSKELPGVRFVRNKRHPRVIHAIDKRLLKLDDYVVEKKVDLKYNGVIGNISRKLNETLPAIGPRTFGVIGEVFDDSVTEANIAAKEKRIRDILTDAVPLKSYDPILWRGWTAKRDGAWFTEIQFYGPRRDR